MCSRLISSQSNTKLREDIWSSPFRTQGRASSSHCHLPRPQFPHPLDAQEFHFASMVVEAGGENHTPYFIPETLTN